MRDRMKVTYDERSAEEEEDRRHERDRGLVKSYLIEAHLDGDVLKGLTELVARHAASYGKVRFRVCETEDEGFVRIEAQKAGETRVVALYVDVLESRFWKCHTTHDAAKIDDAVKRLVRFGRQLDRLWLPAVFLHEMSNWGSFQAFKLNHDRRDYEEPQVGRQPPQVKKDPRLSELASVLKLSLKSSRFVPKVLRFLTHDEELKHYSTLSAITVKRRESDDWQSEQYGSFSIDDVRYDSKFTTRGTELDCHEDMLQQTLRRYKTALHNIELCRLGFARGKLSGDPFIFSFPKQLPSVQRFCEFVFASAPPFNLLGINADAKKDLARVLAVDIHSGGKLRFEIFPDFLRVYLDRRACGNSLMRLWTNLEQHVSATVELQDHQGNSLQKDILNG